MSSLVDAGSRQAIELLTDVLATANLTDDVAESGVRVLLHSNAEDLILALDPGLPQWYANTYKGLDGATIIGKPESRLHGPRAGQVYAVVQASDQVDFVVKKDLPPVTPDEPARQHRYHFYFSPKTSELLLRNGYDDYVEIEELSAPSRSKSRICRGEPRFFPPGCYLVSVGGSSITMRILNRAPCTLLGPDGKPLLQSGAVRTIWNQHDGKHSNEE